jgi:hypothetical protein
MNTSTTEKTEPTVRTEWGVQETWPDGHVEYRRQDNRGLAEGSVRMANGRDDWPQNAQVVTRTVTTTPWAPVDQT